MPLPTSVPVTAEAAFAQVLGTAQSVSTNLRGVRDLIVGGSPVVMDNMIGLYQALNASRDTGLAIQGVEGLSDYAKDKLGASYDIEAEFMASVVACKAVTDHLLATMPGDGAGSFIGWRLEAGGKVERLAIDTATLGPLRDLIEAALATFA